MEVNVIFKLRYRKSSFFVENIKLNEKDSKWFSFQMNDSASTNHQAIFGRELLRSLPEKDQVFHFTLKADLIDRYFDLANKKFWFKGWNFFIWLLFLFILMKLSLPQIQAIISNSPNRMANQIPTTIRWRRHSSSTSLRRK